MSSSDLKGDYNFQLLYQIFKTVVWAQKLFYDVLLNGFKQVLLHKAFHHNIKWRQSS